MDDEGGLPVNTEVLRIENVTFRYPSGPELFNGLNLTVEAGGQITCLLGPSGAGKSTLLQLILGFVRPSSGNVVLGARPLPVFQQFERMILPWFTVQRNITWGLAHIENHDELQIARLLEIEDCLDNLPNRLSGGQRQRVVLARAVIRRPQLLLFDEPFSNLDAGTLDRVLPAFRHALKQQGSSALWITHNLVEAANVADILYIFGRGGGLRHITVNVGADKHLLIQEMQTALS